MLRINWSYYVEIYEKKEFVILYNMSNRRIVAIKHEIFKLIQKYIQIPFECDTEIQETVSELYLLGFLKRESVTKNDEISRFLDIKSKNKDDVCEIYFMPTLNCNMRCKYCMIGNTINKVYTRLMSNKDIKQTVRFIFESSEFHDVKDMRIVLFGGEPSMAINQNILFLEMSNKLKRKDQNIDYILITNGYIWNERDFDRLINLGVSTFQVTLDGPKEIHDKRRFNVEANGTFDKIMNNIEILSKKNIILVIRINIDYENSKYIVQLLNYIYNKNINRNKNIVIQIATVDPSDFYYSDSYNKEILNNYYEIYRQAFTLGFNVGEWHRGCSLQSKYTMAVDPEGYIYKCPSHAGKKDKNIGDVYNGFNDRYYQYLESHLNDRCKVCKYLGMCNGGCLSVNEILGNDYCYESIIKIISEAYITSKYQFDKKQTKRIKELID